MMELMSYSKRPMEKPIYCLLISLFGLPIEYFWKKIIIIRVDESRVMVRPISNQTFSTLKLV